MVQRAGEILKQRLTEVWNNPAISWIHPIVDHILEKLSPSEVISEAPLAFIDITEYHGEEKRLLGFQKVARAAKQMTDSLPLYGARVKVINPDYFEKWMQNNGELPKNYEQQLYKESEEFLITSPNESVGVRRSYHSPDGVINGGPTHNDLKSADFIVESVIGPNGFYAYAKEKKLHLVHGAVITAFEQDWIDPPDIVAANGNVLKLPAGGNAYIEAINPDGGLVIKVSVCLGENSGIDKGHNEIDEYRILYMPPTDVAKAGKAYIINSKIYPQKTKMQLQRLTPPPVELHARRIDLETQTGKDSGIYEVDIDATTGVCQPLIDQTDLHRIATVTGLLYHNSNNTPHKVEFTKGTFPGKSGYGNVTSIAILEAVPTTIPETNGHETTLHSGILRLVLVNRDDITKLEKSHSDWKEDFPLVYLTHDLIRQFSGDPELFDRIKQLGRRLTIVAPLTHTEHKARELEATHNLYGITPTSVDLGINYEIKKRGGITWIVRKVGRGNGKKKRIPRILTIQQAIAMNITQHEHIGGKGAGIANLLKHNYHAEPTIIMSSTLFQQVIHANNLDTIFEEIKRTNNQDNLIALFKIMYKDLKIFPRRSRKEIQDAIHAAFSENPLFDNKISVRSDASFEDLRGAPFAGKLESILDIDSKRTHEIDEAMLRVMRSYFKPGIAKAIFDDFAPRDRRLILNQLAGSVMIEPMVKQIVASGTLFGKEVNGQKRPNIIVLQATLSQAGIVDGIGEQATLTIKFDSTTRRFDGITVNKDGYAYELDGNESLSDNRLDNVLSYREVKSLILLAESMKSEMGDPQDAEWALTTDGIFHFLQARPL